MKHFEDTWEEAEDMSHLHSVSIEKIKETLNKFNNSKEPIVLGELLFYLATYSKEYNINVDAALSKFIDNLKIEFYD